MTGGGIPVVLERPARDGPQPGPRAGRPDRPRARGARLERAADHSYHNDKQNETGFSIYLDYNSTSTGADTLDTAIISAICKKYDASDATYWIAKMLGITED